MLKIKIKKLSDNAVIPQYMTEYSAGLDIYACTKEEIILKPMSRKLIPTGIALSIPKGYEAQIRPRSGIAI